MDLKDIFIGKPVKTTTKDWVFWILRIDETMESIWCIPLNSIDNETIECKVEELKEV